MHYLYILHSQKINRFYVGETPDVAIRHSQHLNHYFPNSFTNSADDWVLKFVYEVEKREDALYLEKFIKRMKSRKFIERLILNSKPLEDILLRKD